MSHNNLKSPPAVTTKRMRYLPFPPIPRPNRRKLPQIHADCGSCLEVSDQWSKLFEELCDKCEDTQKQLQKASAQLLKAKAAGYLIGSDEKNSVDSSHKLQTQSKIQVSNNPTQTIEFSFEKATQTEVEIQVSHNHTQTTESSFEKATQAEMKIRMQQNETPNVPAEERTKIRSNIAVQKPDDSAGETTEIHHISTTASLKIRQITCSKYVTMHDHTYVRSDLTESQNLYKCKVCAKFYCYDKMRKHYLQFINSAPTRNNRYGHSSVSVKRHKFFLEELKASRKSLI